MHVLQTCTTIGCWFDGVALKVCVLLPSCACITTTCVHHAVSMLCSSAFEIFQRTSFVTVLRDVEMG